MNRSMDKPGKPCYTAWELCGKTPVSERIWIMKKSCSDFILAVLFGLAGFALRLLQNRTGFEPDTGLPVSGNLPASLLPVLLALAGAALYLVIRRSLPGRVPELPFARLFRLGNRGLLTIALLGACTMALSGVLELANTLGGSAAAVSADGMEIVASPAGAGGSVVLTAVLSAAAGACMAAGILFCRKTEEPPLILLAVPVCLLARLILVYRLRSTDPVLTDYYLELLGLMLLILGTYRLSGFAAQAGRPRIFALYTGLTAVLALTMLADGPSAAALLTLGGALALGGFRWMLNPTGEAASPD